jgi:hypothetical protein
VAVLQVERTRAISRDKVRNQPHEITHLANGTVCLLSDDTDIDPCTGPRRLGIGRLAAPEPWQLPGASEYDEIEYAGLPVDCCIFVIMLCYKVFSLHVMCR